MPTRRSLITDSERCTNGPVSDAGLRRRQDRFLAAGLVIGLALSLALVWWGTVALGVILPTGPKLFITVFMLVLVSAEYWFVTRRARRHTLGPRAER